MNRKGWCSRTELKTLLGVSGKHNSGARVAVLAGESGHLGSLDDGGGEDDGPHDSSDGSHCIGFRREDWLKVLGIDWKVMLMFWVLMRLTYGRGGTLYTSSECSERRSGAPNGDQRSRRESEPPMLIHHVLL